MSTRKGRGQESERIAARWFTLHGWPYAMAAGAGRPGADVTGMPGLAPEVKAKARVEMGAWLRQASDREGVPFVIYRPPGFGPAAVDCWQVTMRLDEFTWLLHRAGYGDCPGDCDAAEVPR
jgi:hypothetical protein